MSEKQKISARKRQLAIPKEELSRRMREIGILRWERMSRKERKEWQDRMQAARNKNK